MTASRLLFRNLDVDPDDPVETWPIEAIQTALDRGTLHDWRRIMAVIQRDPWGPVARTVEYVLSYDRPYGTAPLFERAIERERCRAEVAEKREVADELGRLVAASGLTRADFADRLGTSASRLSTYLAGKVTPSAALLVRARRVSALQSHGEQPERRLSTTGRKTTSSPWPAVGG